jgi:hypothetical protein
MKVAAAQMICYPKGTVFIPLRMSSLRGKHACVDEIELEKRSMLLKLFSFSFYVRLIKPNPSPNPNTIQPETLLTILI